MADTSSTPGRKNISPAGSQPSAPRPSTQRGGRTQRSGSSTVPRTRTSLDPKQP